jgi:hypothetical protein
MGVLMSNSLWSNCFVSWARSGLPFDICPSNRFLLGLPSTAIVDCLLPTSSGVLAGLALRAADRLAAANDARAALARIADRLSGRLADRRRAARLIDRADRRWARLAARSLIALGDPAALAAESVRLAAVAARRVDNLARAIGRDFAKLLDVDARSFRLARAANRVASARLTDRVAVADLRANARRAVPRWTRMVRSWFSARRADLIAIVARGGYFSWGGGFRPVALC